MKIEWLPSDQAHSLPLPEDERAQELAIWWYDTAHGDLEMLLPKAAEYSAHDLTMTGWTLRSLFGVSGQATTDAELTCWFYLLSKVMRAMGALKEGRSPSVDTIRDVRVYATMIERIREMGGWPE